MATKRAIPQVGFVETNLDAKAEDVAFFLVESLVGTDRLRILSATGLRDEIDSHVQ